jgi:hypothetical protein
LSSTENAAGQKGGPKMSEIEFVWELIYCDADTDCVEIIWADKKTGVHKNEVMSMDGIDSNYIVRDENGIIKVLKTLDEVKNYLRLV